VERHKRESHYKKSFVFVSPPSPPALSRKRARERAGP
jgi:hypothetical protein